MKYLNYLAILIALCVPIYSIPLPDKRALLIIDVQHCFTSGGSLAVPDGDAVVPVINSIRYNYSFLFDLVVETQDWHCSNHVSFASQYEGLKPFTTIPLTYNSKGELCESSLCHQSYAVKCNEIEHKLNQTLWPDHCIMNTPGAEFHDKLYRLPSDVVVKKGYHCQVDSYSAFFDNGGFTSTELDSILQSKGITSVFVTGLALDFCVHYTAIDAHKLGYNTYVVVDATRGIAQNSIEAAQLDMTERGIKLINSTDLINFINRPFY